MIKNVKQDVEFEVKSRLKTRIQHVSNVYASWIGKYCASFTILKV